MRVVDAGLVGLWRSCEKTGRITSRSGRRQKHNPFADPIVTLNLDCLVYTTFGFAETPSAQPEQTS
jgi:hypothetical protein